MDVLLPLTGEGARLVSEHARSQGLSRRVWVRRAIREQLLREGVVEVPDLSPYTSDRLLRAVDSDG
jgi:hypothetical protein